MMDLSPARPVKILVADGTREDLSFLSTLLKSHGYHVLPADSGELALASLQCHKPDLMLLGVRLPGTSGLEVCRQVRENAETADVPVIFITALDEARDKVAGFQAGGADFITKPCREEEVLLKVRTQLEMHFLRRELKGIARSLYNERELLRTALLYIGDGVILTDENCRVTMMNDVAGNKTGRHRDSAIGQPFHTVFSIINEQTREPAKDPLEKVLETGKAVGLGNHTALISSDGFERPIAGSAAPIRDITGKTAGAIAVFRDVTNERHHLNEIEFLSFHDHLTELYNRRFLEAELSRLDEPERLPLTLVIGDLNGLKITNDAFGHFAGDDLLRRTAAILRKCFRPEDVICRYGGDEFVILLPGTNARAAEDMVKKVLDKVRGSKSDKGILSISFGWDTKTEKNQSIAQVLKNAEDNMYKRKLLESPSIRSATISAIVQTLYEKNSREEAHSKRVSELGSAISQAMGLPESEINKIKTAGLLHDIGKIMISTEILEKRTPLTSAEWAEIRRHPETAYRILSGVAELSELAEAVRQHHERWDGKGYPWGLRGGEITLAARIICVADAFDAMTSQRPYRSGMPVKDAREELHRQAGAQFDPEIVRVFLDGVSV